MERRILGTSGIAVSRLGLGTSTWGPKMDRADVARQLRSFVEAGGNLIDTAASYGLGVTEEIIGDLLGRTVRREDVVLATKAGMLPDHKVFRLDGSTTGLIDQLDGSLRKLGTDHVDLWQLHLWVPGTPIEESLAALDLAVTSGRARAIGISNYAGWQTGMAGQRQRDRGTSQLASIQMEYSLIARSVEREVAPAAEELGMSLIAWGCIGRGVLTGKYRNGIPRDRTTSKFFNWYIRPYADSANVASVVDALTDAAGELGVRPGAVALSWACDRPLVASALVGARSHEQLADSLPAADLVLPAHIRESLDKMTEPSFGYPERSWGG